MKRRSLFLSVFCSVILTVALATFTIVGVVKTNKGGQNGDNQATNVSTDVSDKKPDLNEDRDGSKDFPYLINSVDTFNHYIGSYGYANTEEGEEICYYELADDVDFAGVDYVTLFNNGKAFNGKIDGKGFALKNISINVNKGNLINFAYQSEDDADRYNVHIAVFGAIENAEIKDLKINNISVNVADEVYTYVSSGFAKDYGDAVNEITVSTLAAIAKNSDVSVEVEGVINADADGIYAENYVQGYNAVGGVVAVANGSTISNTKVVVGFNSGAPVEGDNKNYFVGGVAGYVYHSTIIDTVVNFDVKATYEQAIYVGGVAGYAFDAIVENVDVELDVTEVGSSKKVQKGDTINIENYTWVAGAVAIIKADASNKTMLTDVTIDANVNIDVVYAGVVVEVWSTAGEKCVSFKDVVVASHVNVLEAFGFARDVEDCEFNLTRTEVDNENEAVYNVKLTGNVRLVGTASTEVVASAFIFEPCGYAFSNVKVIVSGQIYSQLQSAEQIRLYGDKGLVVI